MNIEALRARRMPSNTDMPDALCLEAAEEIERMRAALEEIARYDCGAAHEWCRNKARKALTAAKDQDR